MKDNKRLTTIINNQNRTRITILLDWNRSSQHFFEQMTFEHVDAMKFIHILKDDILTHLFIRFLCGLVILNVSTLIEENEIYFYHLMFIFIAEKKKIVV